MQGRLASAFACAFLLVMVIASGGCEAIVNGQLAAFPRTCTGTDPSACPPGEYCKGAGCTACETRDICDGYDNDCDGKVDDGTLSDNDGDGYSFCGYVDSESGKLVNVDCDDQDAAIHPGVTEVCNGKDDDCDGIIDNADVVCPANETCVPKTGQCISSAQACNTTNCPAPKVCDPSTQQCVTQNTGLGAPCNGDKACTSGICADSTIFGSPGGVCTKPCCVSADCDSGFVCFGAGTGGNYCVKPDTLGRGALGNGGGGGPCGAGSDCRSGVCTGNRCEDTCCNDGNCAAGTACSLTSFAGRTTFACINPPGPVDPNAECRSDADCRSGICIGYTDGISTYRRCSAACCGSSACGAFNVPGAFGTQIPVQVVCNDDQVTGGTVPLCDSPKQGEGTGRVGDPCGNNGDCFSDRCVQRLCTDVCCVDADCGRPGWVCRPAQVGPGTYLRCMPAP
jgi:hypothetical protein